MMFLRTPDGKQWFIGGINDEALAHAVLAAVNFALDCCERSDPADAAGSTAVALHA